MRDLRRQQQLARERQEGRPFLAALMHADIPRLTTDYGRLLLGTSNGRVTSRRQTLSERDGDAE